MHVHGGGGASFSAGTAEEALTVIDTHRRHGTTTMVASTVTGELDDLAQQAGALSELVEQGDLAGVHFEGPFISRERCGAHDPALLRDPDPADVRKLLDAARGTRADDDARARAARRAGLRTAARGQRRDRRRRPHRRDVRARPREAVDAGATVATHLFNAMPGARPPGARPGRRAAGGRAGHRRADQRRHPSPPRRPGAGLPAARARTGSRSSPTRWARPAWATAATRWARWRWRCGTGSPGWSRAAPSPARRSPWTRRSGAR